MLFWTTAILFLSAFLGGIIVLFIKPGNYNLLKLTLSFSGAYLFSITVLHLVPDVYIAGGHSMGVFVLIGFLFQLLLERFSEGVEHGHIHSHQNEGLTFPLGIMTSLCLHAFLEGMPLAKGHEKTLLFGIATHHIPASFALGSLLREAKQSKNKILTFIFIFALMSPLGYISSYSLSIAQIANIDEYFNIIMAMVIGIFLHISTTILFESSSANHHHFNRNKLIAIILGVFIALMSFYFH